MKPKPIPKPLGRPRKPHAYLGININVTPAQRAWLTRDGNASARARKAIDAAMGKEKT